jgi:hypothetical protein
MEASPLGAEDSLSLAFANKLTDSPEFISWVLSQTKFAEHAKTAKLLSEEQAAARTARFWWRNWWCHVPDLGEESETDIFLVFEDAKTGKRFSLHIENKIANSTFTPNQEASYAVRATYMLHYTKAAEFRCTDFDTVLIAPHSFRNKYREQSDQFGCFIAHEDIAKFIPSFGSH